METAPLLKGSLLIANGNLHDPNFRKSAVLLAEHNDQGAYGLVINRPMELFMTEVLPDNPIFKESDERLFCGGPVEPQRIQLLHNCDAADLKAYKLCNGVYMGGDFDMLLKMRADSDGEILCRFFSGYSGWGQGQLENELEQKAWIVHKATADMVFRMPPAEVWPRVLTSMGDYYSFVARMPDDPGVN